jgi:hypothetical protein
VLEFVLIYFLAKHNGDIVEAKGVPGTRYRWYTVGLWFGGEACGALIGIMLIHGSNVFYSIYACAIVGAIIGVMVAWYIAQGVPARAVGTFWQGTHLTPPTGVPAWSEPNPALAPFATIPGNVEVMVVNVYGEWAQVRAVNGFVGFVDLRTLQPKTVPSAWH